MRALVRSVVLAACGSVILAAGAAACGKEASRPPAMSEAERAAAAAKVGTVGVDELAALLARGAAIPVDANRATVRDREGVIPGARLLSDARVYDLRELPDDRAATLVFYCVNEQCTASHLAAERAVASGWQDVRVLPAGIAGWKGAGQATSSR